VLQIFWEGVNGRMGIVRSVCGGERERLVQGRGGV
jgi:hypothetical protein